MDQQHKQFRTIKIFYASEIALVVIFFVIAIVLNLLLADTKALYMSTDGMNEFNDTYMITLFIIAFNIIALISIAAGLYMFKRQISKIGDPEFALSKYLMAMIYRSAPIVAAGGIFLAGWDLTSSSIFLIESIVIFTLLIRFYPTKKRLYKETYISL